MQNVCNLAVVVSLKLITSSRVTKKGYPIVVEIFVAASKRQRKTIGHSFKEHWNFQYNEPYDHHPNYNELIPVIKDYNAKISEITFRKYNYDLAYKLLFNSAFKKAPPKMLLEFISEFIEEKKKMNIQSDQFKGVLGVFKKYLKGVDVPLETIDYEWLQDFKIHKLQSKTCNESGVVTYFRHFRTIYFEAQRRKSLNIPPGNPFKGLIKSTPKPDVIEFSPKDFKELLKYEPSRNQSVSNRFKMLRKVRLTLLQFYLGGHDFADLAMWEWVHIKAGRRLVFKRFKNRNNVDGGELVDNFICDEAVRIIEAYGDKTSKRIFSFIPSPLEDYEAYKNKRNNHNRFLKSISKQLGAESLSSKSMRYVFRTYAGELLIHDLIITKIQGHSPKGVTYGYQGRISHEVQDREHQKIIDLVR